MSFLYHRVPQGGVIGSTLVPLAKLQGISPNLYHREVSAYEGRTEVLDKVVPSLGCPQREVLFFSLVHPKELLDALRKAGVPRQEPLLCFKIPANLLLPSSTTIRLYNKAEDKIEFHEYDPTALHRFAGIPPWTSEYYRTCSRDTPVFYWKGIPQILYRGTLNISGLEIVEGR